MCLKVLAIAGIVLFANVVQSSAAETRPVNAPSSDEQRLINAQRENEEAQAKYYNALTQKLLSPTPTPAPPSLGRTMAENPASVVGVIGAIVAASLAAIVGLLTLYVNHRAGLRFHYDTQFFETLKLFGDKNKDIRSGAAGNLGLIANREVPKIGPHPFSILKTERPYFGVAHNQLLIGLTSEQDKFTLLLIRRGIYQIVESNPTGLGLALINANGRLQTGLRHALAHFFVACGAKNEQNLDEFWQKVPRGIYEREVLESIVNYKREFADAFVGATLVHAPISENTTRTKKHLASAYRDLEQAIYRLYLIVDIYTATLRKSDALRSQGRNYPLFLAKANLQEIDLTTAKLQEAILTGANLQKAKLGAANLQKATLTKTNLANADLQGVLMQAACLDNADITDTRIAGAQIDASTSMRDVKWWKANYFTDDPSKPIDDNLIRLLHERDKARLPRDPREAHRSVQSFIAEQNGIKS